MVDFNKIGDLLYKSAQIKDSELHSFENILAWIERKNRTTHVNVKLINFEECDSWIHDLKTNRIRNKNNGFFSITGIISRGGDDCIAQPILLQNEIGYLGIICKIINGTLFFLMQAKIEPGNVNVVQISPTIQATKSNFTRKHGGSFPPYLEHFQKLEDKLVLVDQIQSEQSSRFIAKRNRNIVILLENKIEERDSHCWMTYRQIMELLKYPNLVNMDTRTVLSCLPLSFYHYSFKCRTPFFKSVISQPDYSIIKSIFTYFNDYKMTNTLHYELCDPFKLPGWIYKDGVIKHSSNYSFDVVFCKIEIEGREVKKWEQPLFRAKGESLFLLLCRRGKNGMEYLVSTKSEIGTFDMIELGPTLQIEPNRFSQLSTFESNILLKMKKGKMILFDNILSEEGGRFYHEQNRNVIMEVDSSEFQFTPNGFFWCTFSTLNFLCQINNMLNIQLRNLLSLINNYEKKN